MKQIILFDGACNFCDKSVQFIITRDPDAFFSFASLQSDIGKQLAKNYSVPEKTNSLILLDGKQYYVKATAVFRICEKLSWPWKAFTCFRILPLFISNFLYDTLAKNRYRLFGKRESCMIPAPHIRNRFLE
ncbi:hypothetical protein JCM9140_4701 [Halalkalibacter wakoensis JCM 9140]|uniref:Thiol-disulfide oxidoreductase n=1 Tax=Halalkalibacter wakoensis JCM 9140 TaxID=1236970 RepID=W4Q9Z0_9BACI|nr:thiol-disulfide oxidoreductase DCC family protein [Halalkalibacter wakoensis]GAE28463.1 hypothetical protein JCM9140_4701 [Halalkalibacter wakoensis JCM 9140]